jgi:chorismate synthase
MAGNTFGQLFTITTFGESHGPAIGGVIDGCPPGVIINPEYIRHELARRRPGQSEFTTQRNEPDKVEFLSGILENKSTGTSIGFIIRNNDTRSTDYIHLKNTFRPSHADFTYEKKYGFRDARGGGRSSARETAARVVAGAIAKAFLQQYLQIDIKAWVDSIGPVSLNKNLSEIEPDEAEFNPVRCPDEETAQQMMELIKKTAREGDTLGGTIRCLMKNIPAGLGDPVFDKFHAQLGKAMLSINAVKGFEYGEGFDAATMKGSEHNDLFTSENGQIKTQTNHSGGIQGGITNGADINFRLAFKPIATIMQLQPSVDRTGKKTIIEPKGRHDVTVLPRAVPIVEAMAALVTADFVLRQLPNHLLRNEIKA